jgi:hypothetical protein
MSINLKYIIMKKVKIESTKEIKGFYKMMKEMLLNGAMMTTVKEEHTNEVLAKVTNIRINGDEYFGFWEKAVFEDDDIWFLSSFGDVEKVEKAWIEYRDKLIKSGTIWEIKAA